MDVDQVQTGAEPAPVTIVDTPKPSMEDTMAAVYEKMHPDSRVGRTEKGEFKSKEVKEPQINSEVEGAEESDATKEITQEPAKEDVEPEKSPAIDVPLSWTSEQKEKWASLPPDLQKYIADRESQAQSKISELGRAVKATESIRPHLEPLERLAQQGKVSVGEAVQRFLAANDRLQRDPYGAIHQLAQTFGVDLSRFSSQPNSNNGNTESANLSVLTQYIHKLEQQLSETNNRINTREQAETQAREKSLLSQIEKFREGKDYWPDIEDVIYEQIVAMRATNPEKVTGSPMEALKEAEERAIQLTPKVREKLGKAAKEEAEKKAQAEARKKADEAKKIASMNVRSSTGANPKSTPKSLVASMEEIYDRIQARG